MWIRFASIFHLYGARVCVLAFFGNRVIQVSGTIEYNPVGNWIGPSEAIIHSEKWCVFLNLGSIHSGYIGNDKGPVQLNYECYFIK